MIFSNAHGGNPITGIRGPVFQNTGTPRFVLPGPTEVKTTYSNSASYGINCDPRKTKGACLIYTCYVSHELRVNVELIGNNNGITNV